MEENPLKLSNEDLVLFKERKYEKMSIFSQRHNSKKLGVYNYFETYDGEDVYYMNHTFGSEFFLDKDKKLLVHSNYQYEYFTSMGEEQTINYIKRILDYVNCINDSFFENAILINNEVSAVGKWFDTYGHFSDEVFSLCDFNNELLLSENKEATPIINYQVINSTKNYELLGNYLFDGKLINTSVYGWNIIKFKKLRLLPNFFSQYAFHSFPRFSRDKVLSKIYEKTKNHNDTNNNNIFITRGIAISNQRNLDNQCEIETYLKSNGYIVINPENILLDEFINYISNANNIIMTWGSAMVNMCYFKDNTNVTILKSRSYEAEPLNLFQKIITRYNLNVNVILHNDNKISIPFI